MTDRFVKAATLSDTDRAAWMALPGAHEIRLRHGIGAYTVWIMVSGDVPVVGNPVAKKVRKGKKTA